jgi:hypothetical protein
MITRSLLLIATLFISCAEPNVEQEEIPIEEPTSIENSDFCYAYRSGENYRIMQLSIQSDEVLGFLQNYLPGKDISNGSVSGNIEGDTLFLRFLYQLKQKDTMRQLAFLKQGDYLLEGSGPLMENPFGDMVFERGLLQFSDQNKFSLVTCKENQSLSMNYQIVWSVLKGDYTDLKRFGVELKGEEQNAYLVMSDDSMFAEVILPQNAGTLILNKNEKDGKSVFTQGPYILNKETKYQLKKSGEILSQE